MERAILKCLLLISMAALAGCDAARLDLAIRTDQQTFNRNEPVAINVKVRNPGRRPVKTSFFGPESDRPIVLFHIVGPDGRESRRSTKKDAWCGTGVDNYSVPAGQEYRFAVDLSAIEEWGGTQPEFVAGHYVVSASLWRSEADGGSALVGQSSSITFEVLGDQ